MVGDEIVEINDRAAVDVAASLNELSGDIVLHMTPPSEVEPDNRLARLLRSRLSVRQLDDHVEALLEAAPYDVLLLALPAATEAEKKAEARARKLAGQAPDDDDEDSAILYQYTKSLVGTGLGGVALSSPLGP